MSGLTPKELAELTAENTAAGAIALINRFKEARAKRPVGAATATAVSRAAAAPRPSATGAASAAIHTRAPSKGSVAIKSDDGSDVLTLVRAAKIAGFKREAES